MTSKQTSLGLIYFTVSTRPCVKPTNYVSICMLKVHWSSRV